ncbi:MAG: PASTA domain-containing protein, partial [Deltaproteobacteria bacterium]|nr:PASTA domain-containing protein [Deltaproteobacteria bacterium]
SNIGSAKIGHLLGAKRFHRYLEELGFGKRVGLQLSESRGILRRPRDWSEADLFSTSFGQSISVTAAQMAHAYLVLASGGVTRPLNIVLNEEHRSKEEPKRIYSANVCREVLLMMREVVDTGTGKRAAIPGVSVAGKTGTAQKAGRHGKYSNERLASFVGLIPAEKPRYFCIVMLDEPTYNKYGGIVAAPVFKDVMTHVLAYYGELPAEALAKLSPQDKNDKLAAQSGQQQASSDAIAGDLQQDITSPLSAKTPAGKKSSGGFPDVTGLPVRQAVESVARYGAVPQFKGKGSIIIRQDPAPGSPLPPASSKGSNPSGLKCTLWLSEK